MNVLSITTILSLVIITNADDLIAPGPILCIRACTDVVCPKNLPICPKPYYYWADPCGCYCPRCRCDVGVKCPKCPYPCFDNGIPCNIAIDCAPGYELWIDPCDCDDPCRGQQCVPITEPPITKPPPKDSSSCSSSSSSSKDCSSSSSSSSSEDCSSSSSSSSESRSHKKC